MMGNQVDVHTRISMLEGQIAAIGARAGLGRGGGRVGSGMAAALEHAAQAAQQGMGPSASAGALQAVGGAATGGLAGSLGAMVATGVTAGSVGPVGSWAARLPADGAPYAAMIEQAARRHGLDPALLGALVWTESGFDPGATSPAGAIGLGQLMPGTAAELGVDPTDPAQNLDGAARYLREQLDRFGDTRLALAAYNAGPARVAAAGGVPNIDETMTYVARVTERATILGGS